MILLLGTWEVSRLVEVSQILDNAAREGARQATTGLMSGTQVQQIVLNYLLNAGIPTTHATVTVSDLTSPGTDPTNANQMDQLQVSVSIPFSDVRWTDIVIGYQYLNAAQWSSHLVLYQRSELSYFGYISSGLLISP